jgi:GNAT superfamily N-acetyltransferase
MDSYEEPEPRTVARPSEDQITIVPANEATWADLQAVFDIEVSPSSCWCQRYRMLPRESWASVGAKGLAARLHEQTACDRSESTVTSGLVAYLAGEPVGWCAVAPRSAHARLLRDCRVPWAGRSEDKTDASVWAVTCFVIRPEFRRRGISRTLVRAAVAFARQHGARAVEGYPMRVKPGRQLPDGGMLQELHVGSRNIFDAAGFTEVSHPTGRRVVMRIDF